MGLNTQRCDDIGDRWCLVVSRNSLQATAVLAPPSAAIVDQQCGLPTAAIVRFFSGYSTAHVVFSGPSTATVVGFFSGVATALAWFSGPSTATGVRFFIAFPTVLVSPAVALPLSLWSAVSPQLFRV